MAAANAASADLHRNTDLIGILEKKAATIIGVNLRVSR